MPRRDGFNITPASEVMAILCLATDFSDLGERLAEWWSVSPTRANRSAPRPIQAVGAMQVLLRDAIHPNLVQTLEGTPAFVHGGPFANIAQGTNTAIATRLALETGRLRRHRGRVRHRPGGGEILSHQMPHRRPEAGGGGDRGHHQGHRLSWRLYGEAGSAISPSTSRTSASSVWTRGVPQPFPR